MDQIDQCSGHLVAEQMSCEPLREGSVSSLAAECGCLSSLLVSEEPVLSCSQCPPAVQTTGNSPFFPTQSRTGMT